MSRLSAFLLKLAGWKLNVTLPDSPKSIICVAPHTSNWDFVWGKLAYSALGRDAGFLMKESWFFFPLGLIFKAIGGVPVSRRRGSSLTETLIEKFNNSDTLTIAITPEGTRSRVATWHTGFLHIAIGAGVPVQLAAIDYGRKEIFLNREFIPSGDIETDMREIKDYYRQFTGKYPDHFTTE